MVDYYRLSAEKVLEKLESTADGLTDEKILRMRELYGYNELAEADRKSTLAVFLEQFKDFLVMILLAAALISAFLGKLESSAVILVVVSINALLGTIQHIKAEQSLNSLKALSSPVAEVLRNGTRIEIPSRELVVGDILYLDAGDYISADGRILQTHSLQVNESSLTGESESVVKTIELIDMENVSIGDRTNMVFSGSFVTYGRAVVVITSIGMDTEIGRIANLLESTREKKTPLQANLDNFGKRLAIAILAISAFIFALDIYRGREIIDSFMFAVSLAVAAIPEALSSIVTIVLALGTQKMAKENAIIRKLHAVESLGSISIICSDKTGTLTQNKMTVQKVFVDNRIIEKNELQPSCDIEKRLVLMSLLCNDAVTVENKEIGDPTEVALVNFGEFYNIDELVVRKEYPRLSEIPFDSERKLMSTVNTINGHVVMITKGALDVLLSRCTSFDTAKQLTPFTEEAKERIQKANTEFSKTGLRVLALAYKNLDHETNISIHDEKALTFVGLIAMMDPPRPESKAAVESCIQAGIKPVMITGDHKITAAAIAKQIGILKNEAEAMEGFEIENMSDEDLKKNVDKVSVFARVSPEHKIRIVKAWQNNGKIVAMTGDGVNDAPALKQADIGISMGVTGTEVAKDASAMVLADDNFSTIVTAISNGRSIYNNIKNSIKFLLSGNTAGIISVLYASLGALPIPFAPVHLLFINLLTDSLPAIAIGLEPYNRDIMKETPRDVETPILNKSFVVEIFIEGILIAIATIAAFHIGLSSGDNRVASTMAFATLCASRLLHGFNSRADESVFKVGLFSNLYIWAAAVAGILLLNSVLLLKPLAGIFETAPLTANQHLTIYILAFMPLLVVQAYKLIFKNRRQ